LLVSVANTKTGKALDDAGHAGAATDDEEDGDDAESDAAAISEKMYCRQIRSENYCQL